MTPTDTTPATDTDRIALLPQIEETLHVDKVVVDRGGVRITRHVSVHEETVDEALREQRVEIERRPVGLLIANGEMPESRHEGNTLIVPVVEEVLVTEKRLLLVEEVRITRIEGTHRQPQTVSLRKEEIVVERLDAERPSAAGPPSAVSPTGHGTSSPVGGTQESSQ